MAKRRTIKWLLWNPDNEIIYTVEMVFTDNVLETISLRRQDGSEYTVIDTGYTCCLNTGKPVARRWRKVVKASPSFLDMR